MIGARLMNDLNVHKVLVIDDEAAILKLFTKTLSRIGYTVDTTDNGIDAINKVITNYYDFVITDIKMPEMSGEDVLHEIKSIKENDLPVIGMSGTPWLLDENLFDAVISKPCSMKELFEVVEKIVVRHPKNI
jgi:DNA-binding response OmpR family regulator